MHSFWKSGSGAARRLYALRNSIIALLMPFAALALQLALWDKVSPLAYFFFYPAVFVSCWIAGWAVGVVSVMLSVVLALRYFVPSPNYLQGDFNSLVTAWMFVSMGLLFCFSHVKLRKARHQAGAALADARTANEMLTSAHEEASRLHALARQNEEHFRVLVEHSPDLILRFDRAGRCIYINPVVTALTGLRSAEILGKTVTEMAIRQGFSAPWDETIHKVVLTALSFGFEFAYSAMGSLRYYQTRVVPELDKDGKVASVLAVARDISAIKGGEAVLRESEQRIHGITANIPGMVFQCQLRHDDNALFFTYLSEGSRAMLGLTPGQLQAQRDGVLARIADPYRQGFIASMHESARRMRILNWAGATTPIDGEVRWLTCRATPRRAGADVIWEGVMMNITDSKRREQELGQSRQLLRELSAHMEFVREEERKRIAREVHDELGQALTALRMDLSLLRLHYAEQNPPMMTQIQSMKAMVDGTIQIVRGITSSLRPVALDLGPTAAIEWLLGEFYKRSGVECTFSNKVSDDLSLDDQRATTLFRIVQESLTNIARHARASKVHVLLALEDDANLCAKITDDGQGFQPEGPRKKGSFGLLGMRERILVFHGTLRITSTPGSGTCVEVCIPLETQQTGRQPPAMGNHTGTHHDPVS